MENVKRNFFIKKSILIFGFLTLFLLGGQSAHSATTAQLNAARVNGVAWLLANQNGDGSWGNDVRNKILATSAALSALRKAGVTGPNYGNGIAWLANAHPYSNDSLARQILVLNEAGVDVSAKASKLLAQKSSFQ
ncbi:MAG: hypothetical protein OEZ58_23715, partial [Gammaproteobacteria bacterium]|nr:hypothetical protein [Gammaproteobacteria bacterium]